MKTTTKTKSASARSSPGRSTHPQRQSISKRLARLEADEAAIMRVRDDVLAELAKMRAVLEAIVRALPEARKPEKPSKRRRLIPNAETIAAMQAAEHGEFMFTGTVDRFKDYLREVSIVRDDANG